MTLKTSMRTVGLALSLAFLVACSSGAGSSGAKLATSEGEWVASVCKVAQDYKDARIKAGAANPLDRTKLGPGQPKDNVLALDKEVEEAATAAAKSLRDVRPPSTAKAYQTALLAEFIGLAAALKADQQALSKATTIEDFTKLNTALGRFLADSEKKAGEEYLKLPSSTVAAIRANQKCGDVPSSGGG